MEEIYSSYIRSLIDRTVAALNKCGFEALSTGNREEAKSKILDLIPPDSTIGVGGSVTLREIGIVKTLESRGHTVYQRRAGQGSQPADLDYRRSHLTCDVFLSSSNAITVEGELVNVDGTGNRVAAMIFGPRKVIVVAGWNKIVPDISAGIQRIRNLAAPLNAKRLKLDVPCVETGYCVDCTAPDNICRVTTIISTRPKRTDCTVVLVAEQLGY